MTANIITGIAIALYVMIASLVFLIRLTDRLTGEVIHGQIVKPSKPATLTLRITATSLLWPLTWAVLLVRENTNRSTT